MNFPIKFKKSAGVPVTGAVHRLISQGNRARGVNWKESADAYRAAVNADPELYHIWIQLGHAYAEADAYEDAIGAYQSAARLRPLTGEPWLHMGHASKRSGDRPRAARFYMAALVRDDVESEAAGEAERLIHAVTKPPRSLLRRIGARIREDGSLSDADDTQASGGDPLAGVIAELTRTGGGDLANIATLAQAQRVLDRLRSDQSATSSADSRPMVFDVTDLVAHFRNHRLPTGIQRVQIEVIATALKTYGAARVSVCCYIDGRDYWIGIEGGHFLALAHLASSGSGIGDADWQAASGELLIRLAIDRHFVVPQRAILVNLGTSWWIYDYYRLIRNAKAEQDILYVPFVHDFIPVMAPEHCVRGVTGDYISWLIGVFQHADYFLVNSDSTRNDLFRVAERLGHIVPEDRVEVVALDADFRSGAEPLPDSTLRQWGLGAAPYALLVSTIESRKNHVLAFETWARLIRDYGADAVPQLVCVGRNGWLNDRAFERLAAHPGLREKVTIIHQVSDEELALLYRACQFTVYPSHYEGWGLPVTESLCYGRVPVIADNSSLPQAGAGFAEIFVSDSVSDFARAVAAVAFDADRRAAREADIRARFKPRTWRAIADQIGEAIVALDARGQGSRPVEREIAAGRYYPTNLYREPAIWKGLASGEIFRVGDGWLWPDTSGCRTRPGGGDLAMTLAEPIAQPRLYLQLAGLATARTRFVIAVGGAEIAAGNLAKDEIRWITADLPTGIGRELAFTVRGADAEPVAMNTGGSAKILTGSISVVGFAICDGENEAERARFVEAAGFGDLEAVNAYRRAD